MYRAAWPAWDGALSTDLLNLDIVNRSIIAAVIRHIVWGMHTASSQTHREVVQVREAIDRRGVGDQHYGTKASSIIRGSLGIAVFLFSQEATIFETPLSCSCLKVISSEACEVIRNSSTIMAIASIRVSAS